MNKLHGSRAKTGIVAGVMLLSGLGSGVATAAPATAYTNCPDSTANTRHGGRGIGRPSAT